MKAESPEGGNAGTFLLVGTHRRAHRADAEDIAFGIYSFECMAGQQEFAPVGVTETPQPGWLALHPSGRYVYAVNELREGGGASAFGLDRASGRLRSLNSRPLPPMPCHCAVDASGKFLAVATFGGGSVHLFALLADGRIGEELDRHIHTGSSVHPQRQTSPHAHAVVVSPDNRFVLVPDLGCDQLLVYALDDTAGRLIPCPECHVTLPALSGPRHAVFSADGRHVYLINEMSATIACFGWEAGSGKLTFKQSHELLPDHFAGLKSGGAIALHPDGRHLYATTRSHGSSGMPEQPGLDQLVWFTVNSQDGGLTLGGRLPSGGAIPRSFAISPSADHLLVGHQCSGTITEFDLKDGVPFATGRSIATPVPVCLLFATC